MSQFNDKLKTITLKELFTVIILLFFIYFLFNYFGFVKFSPAWIYVIIIAYFIYKLRCCLSSLKNDFYRLFSGNSLKYVFLVVILNIFMSYGLLYLSNFILNSFPDLNFLVNFHLSSLYLNASLVAVGGFIATVLISPISEELIFRGVIFNRLKLIMPTSLSILVSSLLFAAMHSYGSIIAAFIFAICMAILYVKTDNIAVPIFAHFLNNFLAESIVILDVNNVLFTNAPVILVISFLAIVSAILIVASIFDEWNNLK